MEEKFFFGERRGERRGEGGKFLGVVTSLFLGGTSFWGGTSFLGRGQVFLVEEGDIFFGGTSFLGGDKFFGRGTSFFWGDKFFSLDKFLFLFFWTRVCLPTTSTMVLDQLSELLSCTPSV